MKTLGTHAKQLWAGELVPQHSAVRSPASNSPVERAIREVQSRVRGLVLALEARVGQRIKIVLPAVYWMIECAGELANKFHRDKEGCTARGETLGEADYTGLVDFDETICFMPQVHGIGRKEHVELRWLEGTFLGVVGV